jgi:hypothetical protein
MYRRSQRILLYPFSATKPVRDKNVILRSFPDHTLSKRLRDCDHRGHTDVCGSSGSVLLEFGAWRRFRLESQDSLAHSQCPGRELDRAALLRRSHDDKRAPLEQLAPIALVRGFVLPIAVAYRRNHTGSVNGELYFLI